LSYFPQGGKDFLLLPPPAGGEGWEGGRIIKNISLKGQNRNILNCYMNCEEIHSYRDLCVPLWLNLIYLTTKVHEGKLKVSQRNKR
ncbi:MAG: hypothetical protein ABR927_12050, partial [Bacteroidales bacterium]